MSGGYDPMHEMSKAVMAIGLELPGPVWEDVRKRWAAVVAHVESLTPSDVPPYDPDDDLIEHIEDRP
jgi:hypothetical protein